MITPPRKVEVRYIKGKGRGVVCVSTIHKGEIIERAPIVVLTPEEGEYIRKASSILKHYSLELTAINRNVLQLGYGMMYNHSIDPNSDISYDTNNDLVDIVALRDIKEGEEVVFNYNFDDKEDFLPME